LCRAVLIKFFLKIWFASLRARFAKMEINNQIALTIIKWVVIVFVAGIIGQFGKSLTLRILDWWKKRKAKSSLAAPSKKHSKLEKKQQKAEIKRLKKSK